MINETVDRIKDFSSQIGLSVLYRKRVNVDQMSWTS